MLSLNRKPPFPLCFHLKASKKLKPYISHCFVNHPSVAYIRPCILLYTVPIFTHYSIQISSYEYGETFLDFSLSGPGFRARSELRLLRKGPGLRGELVGLVREVEEPPHGVPRPHREAEALQRFQGECEAHP